MLEFIPDYLFNETGSLFNYNGDKGDNFQTMLYSNPKGDNYIHATCIIISELEFRL